MGKFLVYYILDRLFKRCTYTVIEIDLHQNAVSITVFPLIFYEY